MNFDKIKPLADRLLVRVTDGPAQYDGTIEIPDTADDSSQRIRYGEVLDIGPGRINKKTGVRLPMDGVEVGDTIIFSKYTGIELDPTGEIVFVLYKNVKGVLR